MNKHENVDIYNTHTYTHTHINIYAPTSVYFCVHAVCLCVSDA